MRSISLGTPAKTDSWQEPDHHRPILAYGLFSLEKRAWQWQGILLVAVEFSPTQPLTIEDIPTSRPGLKIIRLAGPVTIHNFAQFQELTRKDTLPPVLLVDLGEVPYIDSAALGTLVAMHVACEETGRKYALVGANERLKNLFDLAYVRTFLVIYDSREEAETHLLTA